MPSKAHENRGEPNVAALLTWFAPGAGHLYLGRPVFAVAAFAVVIGTFALGMKLSDGMTFQFLQEELRTRLAPALSPEAGNLGALLWQAKTGGGLYGEGPPRAWPSTIALGSLLTALAGILNVMLMSRAFLDAKYAARPWKRCPSVHALAGWAVPGLGHWMQGRRRRAGVIFILLVGLFVLATLLAEGTNLDRERHVYYWAGQFMLGVPAIAAEWLHGHPKMTSYVSYADAGVVLGCLAGLLNILALLDVFAFGETRLEAEEPKEEGSILTRLQSQS